MTKILTSEELEKKWDKFSKIFQTYNEPSTLPVVFNLITNLGITSNLNEKTPKAILEIGCGAGAGSELCLFYKKQSTKLVSTDLSHEMIRLAKERLSIPNDSNEIKEKNFKIQQCNAEELPFEDSSFDKYFANYCLHLVNDPIKMLKESYRVLEIGGMSTFSVWGRSENSNQFTITKKIGDEIGVVNNSVVPSRSSFHLSDIKSLREMALSVGYSKVIGIYSFFNSPISSGSEYADVFLSPPDTQLYAQENPEKFQEWRTNIIKYVDGLLNNGTPIGLEVAIIICTK